MTWRLALAFGCLLLSSAAFAGSDFETENGDAELVSYCDPGQVLTPQERAQIFGWLRESRTGQAVLADFARQYGSVSNLLIQWDSVSYSQVVNAKLATRAPASQASNALGTAVCVHLTRRLPDIEHVADLAHELTHATRLEKRVLHGDVGDVDEFVRLRLAARGGEADAFSVECHVKRDILGHWDSLCEPYADESSADGFDASRVVRDFYNGKLSASLTGETYPIMLSRQYRAMLAKRAVQGVSAQTQNSNAISALENKPAIH